MTASTWSPGSLVQARGREWIVLTGSNAATLRLRPISGSEADQTLIHLALEPQPVTEARFPRPQSWQLASHDAALLLRDALVLSLRRGAGPFRGFGQIAVEPRAYQLVPLLMALKLDPVRLLIADDVGIGKTIEAALIARELLDRGDIDRCAVLCPPHLVDQWITELANRFHLGAVAVTSASASRLERHLPPGESIFTTHSFTVVSLDYIKSDRRRSDFLRACPEFVLVDEAHTCAGGGGGRHQRYELLRGLSENPRRHLVLLTATPHSGDEAAFFRLLGLLDRDFEGLLTAQGAERTRLRERLAGHFVQRRRPDIAEWQESDLFPRRETKELTYKLSGAWETFFDEVLEYCAEVVRSAGTDARRQRLSFWGTLALMRCVASSPAAAAQALRTRAADTETLEDDVLRERLFDGGADALVEDDVEPAVAIEDPALEALIAQAEGLTGQAGDPKLKLLVKHLGELFKDGFQPVVFCRFIATAHYLGRHLTKRFKKATVAVVTGELTADERKEKVLRLGDAEQRLLIATDCLSEGINLQEGFDAVVHYDLSWNPTRHEQREGRVDRFGQPSPVVRATLLYGADNPVDGAVLQVILRKAAKIREELGVLVPLPDEGHSLTQALMRAVLLRRRQGPKQQFLDFGETAEAQAIETSWQDVSEKAKKNRTIFAQRRLKPDEVLPEWHKTLAAIGSRDDVQRFTDRALSRLGSGIEPLRRGGKVPLAPLPEEVRERLEAEGLVGTLRIDFDYPAASGALSIQRSHPLVAVLAETLLERTLGSTSVDDSEDGDSKEKDGVPIAPDPGVLGRVGVWVSDDVEVQTTVVLLRLRHQLVITRTIQGSDTVKSSTLLVEEARALAWSGVAEVNTIEDEQAMTLLAAPPVGDPPPYVAQRVLAKALETLDSRQDDLTVLAERRAEALLADHRRVREAAKARGTYAVKALLPSDVIGLFVLLPRVA